jgi:hypothetical protein
MGFPAGVIFDQERFAITVAFDFTIFSVLAQDLRTAKLRCRSGNRFQVSINFGCSQRRHEKLLSCTHPTTISEIGLGSSSAATIAATNLRRCHMVISEKIAERIRQRRTPKSVYDKFVEFEDRAASVYLHLAAHFSKNPELSSLWLEMGMQEKQHAGFLQFCGDEQLFTENLPDEAVIRRLEEVYREIEKRVADPELQINDAFQIALDLETSEVNEIYCQLTATTHNAPYLWRRRWRHFLPVTSASWQPRRGSSASVKTCSAGSTSFAKNVPRLPDKTIACVGKPGVVDPAIDYLKAK